MFFKSIITMAQNDVFDFGALLEEFNQPSTQPSVTGARAAGGIEGLVILFNSTEGKITLSAEVAQQINVQDGDTVIFHDNLEKVNEAISKNAPAYQQFAKAFNLDPKAPTTAATFRNKLLQFYVGQGYQRIGNDGKPVLKAAPVSDAAIKEYFEENKEAIYRKYRDDETKADGTVVPGIVSIVKAQYLAKGYDFPEAAEGASDEDIAAVNEEIDGICLQLIDHKLVKREDLPTAESPVYVGCKAASNGGAKGWKQVSISDMTMWKRAKQDLGDLDGMKAVNRYYKVATTAKTIKIQNGSETIERMLFPLSLWKDEAPAVAINKGTKRAPKGTAVVGDATV
jgi:hypothetical protein